MKKFLVGLASVGGAGLCLAEEASGSSATAETVIQTVTSSMETFASTALAAVGTIITAFLVFYLVKLGIRIIKSVASTSK